MALVPRRRRRLPARRRRGGARQTTRGASPTRVANMPSAPESTHRVSHSPESTRCSLVLGAAEASPGRLSAPGSPERSREHLVERLRRDARALGERSPSDPTTRKRPENRVEIRSPSTDVPARRGR